VISTFIKSCLSLVGVLIVVTAVHADVAFNAWIDFGPTIPGESVAPGHEGWAEVRTFSASHGVDGFSLTCHRRIDKATPLLALACADGTIFPSVRIDVARIENGAQYDFWQLELKDVVVCSYDQSQVEGNVAEESLTLRWSAVQFTYRVFPQAGTPYNVSRLISVDTDGDGLPDAYETLVGLDPDISNLDQDSDGDGLSDVDEYRLGTDPKDPTSFFVTTASLDNPDTGMLVLTWPSVSGESYQIEYSADLMTPFTPLTTVLATGAQTSHTVPRQLAAGFFRVAHTRTP